MKYIGECNVGWNKEKNSKLLPIISVLVPSSDWLHTSILTTCCRPNEQQLILTFLVRRSMKCVKGFDKRKGLDKWDIDKNTIIENKIICECFIILGVSILL